MSDPLEWDHQLCDTKLKKKERNAWHICILNLQFANLPN